MRSSLRFTPFALLAAGLALSSCSSPFGDPQTESPSAAVTASAEPAEAEDEPSEPTDAAHGADSQTTAADNVDSQTGAADSAEADGGADPADSAATDDLTVPHEWRTATASQWPQSEGFGSYDARSMMEDECLLMDEPPSFLGYEADIARAAWGGFGESPDNPDAYRHICQIHSPDNYAGAIALFQGSTPDEVRGWVEDFLDQPDIPEQENDVVTLELDGVEVHALQRWYPTNPSPHGEYQALYLDAEAEAGVLLEVNSLYDEDFDNYSQERIAEDLISLLQGASA